MLFGIIKNPNYRIQLTLPVKIVFSELAIKEKIRMTAKRQSEMTFGSQLYGNWKKLELHHAL